MRCRGLDIRALMSANSALNWCCTSWATGLLEVGGQMSQAQHARLAFLVCTLSHVVPATVLQTFCNLTSCCTPGLLSPFCKRRTTDRSSFLPSLPVSETGSASVRRAAEMASDDDDELAELRAARAARTGQTTLVSRSSAALLLCWCYAGQQLA
jgi:hypothetical protein